MRHRTPDRSRLSQASGSEPPSRMSPFTAWVVSCLMVMAVTTACIAGRPYIVELMREAHLDGDEDGDSVWHRQRQFVSAAEEKEMLELLLAQKMEGVEEDPDAEFLKSWERPIPAGYIKVDDYDDDEPMIDTADEQELATEDAGAADAKADKGARSHPPKVDQAVSRRIFLEKEAPPPGGDGSESLSQPASTSSAGARDRMKRVVENSRYGRYGLRKRASAGSAAINARISGYSGQPTQAPAENPAAGSNPAVESGAAGSDAVGRKATPINGPFVPMLEGAFDMATVERRGQHYGYMSNHGPVKVLEHPKWKLGKDPTWMQAPSVCPGKPTKKGLGTGSPPKKQQEFIKSVLDLMAEGKYTEEVDGVDTVFENRCTFLTRDCAQLNLTYGGPGALKALNITGEKWEKLRTTSLLDLKPRSLGSCALVANSENMLAGKRGPEIDAHDTIFRHNTPVKGFEKAVGKRPTSVKWVKAKYMKQKGAGEAELMYDLLVGLDRLPKKLVHKGKNLLIVNKGGGGNKFVRERNKIYKMAGAGGKNHPSGGFARPLSILASGLCTRVDLYGFSSKPSGKYFERSFKVLDTHMMGFEHWVYRYLMSQGKMCVYGE